MININNSSGEKLKKRKRWKRFVFYTLLLMSIVLAVTYKDSLYSKYISVGAGNSAATLDKPLEEKELSERLSTMNIEDNYGSTNGIYAKWMSKSPAQVKPEKAEPEPADPNGKIVKLTIDDGPNPALTPKVLDILKSYNVRATFFLIGNLAERNVELVQREVNEGHRVLNHTYTHDYNKIYSNPQNLINELNKTDEVLRKIIPDYNLKMMRFPGGSFGRTEYKQAVEKAGYRYFDWNCSTGDGAAGKMPVSTYLENIRKYSLGVKDVTVLMHDAPGKEGTVEALPKIIEYFKAQGYAFDVIR